MTETVNILGIGKVAKYHNGVSRVEYFEALGKVAQWEGLPPYKVDKAISNMKELLNTCPTCDVFLHETNIDRVAPRYENNGLKPFEQGEYGCMKCGSEGR